MEKTLMVFACTALLAASLSACGNKPAENTDTGTASSAAASSSSSEQQQENTLTGSLDEKKNGMFVVTDAEGAAYEFTYDPSDTPKGLDDAVEGDSVTVTRYPRSIRLTARSFRSRKRRQHKIKDAAPCAGSGRAAAAPCADSVALPRLPLGKNAKKSPVGDRFSVSPAGDFAFQDFCSALSRYIR